MVCSKLCLSRIVVPFLSYLTLKNIVTMKSALKVSREFTTTVCTICVSLNSTLLPPIECVYLHSLLYSDPQKRYRIKQCKLKVIQIHRNWRQSKAHIQLILVFHCIRLLFIVTDIYHKIYELYEKLVELLAVFTQQADFS